MIEEIIDAGFNRVELGYDLTLDLVEGVHAMVGQSAIEVVSVHNYCPVPVGAPMGHPELYDLSSTDRMMRMSAVKNTIRTMDLAEQAGADAVVLHCGYAEMRNLTVRLIELAQKGNVYSDKFEKIKTKLILKRDKVAHKTLDALKLSIEALLPEAEARQLKICPENLPLWEAVPSELEMAHLIDEFDSPWLGYWHDIGHGQIRQELGFSSQTTWINKLKPTGFHVHDVDDMLHDHLMPPKGKVDFSAFKDAANSGSILVLEPAPGTPTAHLIEAAEYLKNIWKEEDS